MFLSTLISFGDDFASSTLDVMSDVILSFNTPILLILGVGLFALVISIIIKAIHK